MTSEVLKLDKSSELYFSPGIQIQSIKKKTVLFIDNQDCQRYQVSSQELLSSPFTEVACAQYNNIFNDSYCVYRLSIMGFNLQPASVTSGF